MAWKTRQTWVRPPVMVERILLGLGDGLHLVEGHTRLGALRGQLQAGTVKEGTRHLVWVGSPVATPPIGNTRINAAHQAPFLQWFLDEPDQSEVDDALGYWLACNRPEGPTFEAVKEHIEVNKPDSVRQIELAGMRWKGALHAGAIEWVAN